MRLRVGLLLVVAIAGPAVAQTSGYSGQQGREIKALSAEETADLLAGRGMGAARAAELNHFPGPAHVLELQAQLGLSAGVSTYGLTQTCVSGIFWRPQSWDSCSWALAAIDLQQPCFFRRRIRSTGRMRRLTQLFICTKSPYGANSPAAAG